MGESRVGAQEIPLHTRSTAPTEMSCLHGIVRRCGEVPLPAWARGGWASRPGRHPGLCKDPGPGVPSGPRTAPQTPGDLPSSGAPLEPRLGHTVGFGHRPSPHRNAGCAPGLYSTSKAGWWLALFHALRTGERTRVSQCGLARSALQVEAMNSCRRSSPQPRSTSTFRRVFIVDRQQAGWSPTGLTKVKAACDS